MNFFDEDVDVKEAANMPEPTVSIDDEVVLLDEIPKVEIQNIVYICQMDTEFRLETLVRHLRRWAPQLNMKKFPAVCIRFRTRISESKIAFLIFKNGKIICTGIKTQYHALYLMQKMLFPEFSRLGYSDKVVSFSVYNLVAHTQLPFALDLTSFAKKHAKCTYEPEVFPSAHFTNSTISPVSMSLFSSGLVVINGAKGLEEAGEKFRLMFPEFLKFKMEREAPKVKYTEKQKVMDQIYVDPSRSMPKKAPKFLSGLGNNARDTFFSPKNELPNLQYPIKQESGQDTAIKVKMEEMDREDEVGFGEQFGLPNYATWV
jgi:TATA-box binding protein (TBP) (component of TFIID and TFIIIB)